MCVTSLYVCDLIVCVCDMPEEEFQPQIHSQKIVRRRLFEGEGVNFDAVNVDLKPYQ